MYRVAGDEAKQLSIHHTVSFFFGLFFYCRKFSRIVLCLHALSNTVLRSVMLHFVSLERAIRCNLAPKDQTLSLVDRKYAKSY